MTIHSRYEPCPEHTHLSEVHVTVDVRKEREHPTEPGDSGYSYVVIVTRPGDLEIRVETVLESMPWTIFNHVEVQDKAKERARFYGEAFGAAWFV